MSVNNDTIALLELLEDRWIPESERDILFKALMTQYKPVSAPSRFNLSIAALLDELKAYWQYRSPLMFVPQH